MNEIIENKLRVGNFTSSEIWKLTKSNRKGDDFGAPALTYINQKKRERKMKRSLSTGFYSRDTAWGTFLEQRVFDLIGLEYQMRSDATAHHPTVKGWAGSPDVIVPSVKISDIKCYAPDNFSKYADVIEQKDIELLKAEFEKEYWQLVSNAAINEVPKAEVILYMPYKSELPEIQEMAINYDGADAWKYRFIYESEWYELPILPDDSDYKNLNVFEFEVPKSDIEFLKERVEKANKLIEDETTN